MAQLTEADLKETFSWYESPRNVGDVLIGEDAARLFIEASSSGDDTAVQSFLSQPQWIKTILEKPHSIYHEDRPSQGPNDSRTVMAMRISNLERALTAAAENGQAAVVSTLLAFATQQGVDASGFITRWTVNKIIKGGHAAVFKALAPADPNVANFPLGFGRYPLEEAVRLGQFDVVVMLLELGADPSHPVQTKPCFSLLSLAGINRGPGMTELLLEHGLRVAHSGALHTAARWGRLDTMRLLIEHGADLDETRPGWSNWTPMHFAANRGELDAMKLLEQSGARSDLKDAKGKTPAQLLEEHNNAEVAGQGYEWPLSTSQTDS